MNQEMLERIAAVTTAEGTLAHRMGIKILSASASEVVATMPVADNTQPFGLLHGGASCVLAETIGSVGAALHALRAHGGTALGLEISASHHKAVRSGIVTGVATPLRLGGSVATYEIAISDESGERVCTARLTCLLRRPKFRSSSSPRPHPRAGRRVFPGARRPLAPGLRGWPR